jgi:hypothetical protein
MNTDTRQKIKTALQAFSGAGLLCASLVGPSYVFVFLEVISKNWLFFSLREHFSGAKTLL